MSVLEPGCGLGLGLKTIFGLGLMLLGLGLVIVPCGFVNIPDCIRYHLYACMYACVLFLSTVWYMIVQDPFYVVETVCVAWFSVEFLLRLVASPSKRQFGLDVMNVFDVLAIVPYFVVHACRTSSCSYRTSSCTCRTSS